MAPDALTSRNLNVSNGGARCERMEVAMRSTYWTNANGELIAQSMQTADGIQKGLKMILEERGIATANMKKEDMVTALNNCEDFKNQKRWIFEVSSKAGHLCDFFPKFHPEFNWIERFWGNCKAYARRKCDNTFISLVKTLPEALDSVGVSTMRKFARKAFRYIDAYRASNDNNVSPEIIEWNVKQYSSHRRIDRLLELEEKLEINNN